MRAEAGTVLTINSAVVLEALHAVAPGYPDLAFEGDSLVVAEPFCVLLQFREEMLKYSEPQDDSATEASSLASRRGAPSRAGRQLMPLCVGSTAD